MMPTIARRPNWGTACGDDCSVTDLRLYAFIHERGMDILLQIRGRKPSPTVPNS